MSTVLAGHTFTIPEAFEWAGIDAHLKTMDTQGRAANWRNVTEAYTTPFLLDNYNEYALNLGSSGFTIKQLIYFPEGFEYITEDRLPLLHGYYGDTWSFDDNLGKMSCGGNTSVCNGPDDGPLDFVESANSGSGFAAGWDDVSRREMLTKGSAYVGCCCRRRTCTPQTQASHALRAGCAGQRAVPRVASHGTRSDCVCQRLRARPGPLARRV